MKYLFIIILSLFMSNSFAEEIRTLYCHSGPGMSGKYTQSKMRNTMTINFRWLSISHKEQPVAPGYCTFGSKGLGPEWSNKLYFTKKKPRNFYFELDISPTDMSIDYGKGGKGVPGLHTIVKSMMKMLHNHRVYKISAVHKKVDHVGLVWVVKSIR